MRATALLLAAIPGLASPAAPAERERREAEHDAVGVQAALGQFDELMGEMSRRQITLGEKTKGGFREIVKRTTGRYEMLYGMDTGIFDASPGGRLGQVLEGRKIKDEVC
mgnify:CR=1 FL=1